ncbi:pyridoxamine 5'-phosphate oxidase [Chitinophaga sp. GCM10012297]|uniref:Pyridoxine/pyridoxamine 5'-phosphate oxidase n=1 Tax=Chitinophaga chungangae TaxID=2821488 RepID=A0ABS3YEN4_9BACT|nr:pyridoxamine 5'-phosphate oxidase [Chitinophaga chungangae]MBO9152753.1 pyridoxamine 5'-phosphate oxidase [Chitinophaga chungangae]
MINQKIADLRQDYRRATLNESEAAADPLTQFGQWWQEAVQSELEEPNAMTLATSTADGRPSARIVLLKSFDGNGFLFFTNYESRKGRELEQNPFATLLFFWKELERQVRIEGTVSKAPAGVSDEYFHSRPVGSRIGAAASPQSEVIPDRHFLEERVKRLEAAGEPERPEHWGGYIVKPLLVEFWQGRSSRLHDRLRYTPAGGSSWKIERLAP